MSPRRTPGRPAAGEGVTRNAVLACAFDLLARKGEAGLSMRALAQELGVTPMALYHHVGKRPELIAALVEQAFAPAAAAAARAGEAPWAERLATALEAHCRCALAHPALIQMGFRDPDAFTGPLRELTEALRAALRDAGLDAARVEDWLGLLVDYTHGFALAVGANGRADSETEAPETYRRNLRRLLDALAAEAGAG